MAYNNCRFCKKSETDSDTLVKYGTRHYAHFKCYLEAGKTLDPISAWQVNKFPYFLLKEHGLLNHPKVKEAQKIVADEALDDFNYVGSRHHY